MTRALIVAAVLATAGTASAAPYVGLGIGSSANLTGSLPKFEDNGRSFRLFGGYRFIKYLSVEGQFTRYGEDHSNASYDASSVALALKGSLPIGSGFEVFGRLGIQHTWLETDNNSLNDFDGTGYLLGTGVEYGFHTPIGGAAVFIDFQRLDSNMQGPSKSYDQGANIFSLGVSLTL